MVPVWWLDGASRHHSEHGPKGVGHGATLGQIAVSQQQAQPVAAIMRLWVERRRLARQGRVGRGRVTDINLALCFPDMPEPRRKALHGLRRASHQQPPTTSAMTAEAI